MADHAAHIHIHSHSHHDHQHQQLSNSDANDFVEVTHAPLDAQRAVELVTHASAGAISTFIGTTRDNFAGKRVVRLEYEGYESMAVSELRKICTQVRTQWPSVVGIALFHRLGVVLVKEASVVIAVSSPHRTEALQACAYAIDTLKATVPIWKSEQYEGDARMWKENAEWGAGGEIRRAGCCGPKRVMMPQPHEEAATADKAQPCSKIRIRIITRPLWHIMVAGTIEPRRLALRYAPPGIIVEYAHSPHFAGASSRQLYHHEIDLQDFFVAPNVDVDAIVDQLIAAHDRVLGNRKVSARQVLQHSMHTELRVSVMSLTGALVSLQLARLVRKLIDQTRPSRSSQERETSAVTVAPALPQADYNCVSETQLKQVKQKMDLVFQQNIVRPGESGYEYDKQVAFQPTQEASDWDDE